MQSAICVVYDRNHNFGLGPIPKPKPTLPDTFNQYFLPRLENHFCKILAWSLIYFLNYAYFDIHPSLLTFETTSKVELSVNFQNPGVGRQAVMWWA